MKGNTKVVDKAKLLAKERTVVGKKVRALRRTGLLPLVIYGKDRQATALEVDAHDFDLLYKKAGGNTIVAIDIEKEDESKERKNVLIHRVETDPVSGNLLHADLLQIKMNEKLTTNVPLHFVGDSAAVIDLQGSLLTEMDEVEVECLPADLPHELEVDLGPLVDFDAVVHVSDIVAPAGVVILTDPEMTVARVEAPRSDEELEELEEPVAEGELPESEHGEEETLVPDTEESGSEEKAE
jgi:large subunit ribosomal protein L25